MRPTQRPLTVLFATAALLLAGCTGLSPGAQEGLSGAAAEGRLREFRLDIAVINYEPHEGKRLTSFAFQPENGAARVPGPELRVREGDTVRVTLKDAAHTIHWHGLSVPWGMDGVPFMTQDLGTIDEEFVYEFVAREPGTYWYHCHVDAPSHVDFGLFGAFIVEPRNPAQDPPFDREHTLILHEVDSQSAIHTLFGAATPQTNPPRNPGELPGFAGRTAREGADLAGLLAGDTAGAHVFTEGPRPYYPISSLRYHPYYDTFMINGKSFPETEPVMTKTGDVLRLRVINAGQLVHTLHLHGHHFLVTHKDGYPLPPAARWHGDSLVIGPGERYDLYMNSNNPGIWDLHDHSGAWELGAYAANHHAYPGGMGTMVVYEDFSYAQLPEPQPEPGEARRSGDYMVFAKAKGQGHGGH